MKLFLTADKADRAANFGKNVVKCFYSAGVLFDVLETCFGELPPEAAHYRKYSKMKAAYIHNCLKAGETPVAGPLVEPPGDQQPPEGELQHPEVLGRHGDHEAHRVLGGAAGPGVLGQEQAAVAPTEPAPQHLQAPADLHALHHSPRHRLRPVRPPLRSRSRCPRHARCSI